MILVTENMIPVTRNMILVIQKHDFGDRKHDFAGPKHGFGEGFLQIPIGGIDRHSIEFLWISVKIYRNPHRFL